MLPFWTSSPLSSSLTSPLNTPSCSFFVRLLYLHPLQPFIAMEYFYNFHSAEEIIRIFVPLNISLLITFLYCPNIEFGILLSLCMAAFMTCMALIYLVEVVIPWFREYTRRPTIHWFSRFLFFSAVPMISPIYVEMYLLATFLHGQDSKQLTKDQTTIYCCYANLSLDAVATVLSYIQSDIVSTRNLSEKAFSKGKSWLALASIIFAAIANGFHIFHPEKDNYLNELYCLQFVIPLVGAIFIGLLVYLDHYLTRYNSTRDSRPYELLPLRNMSPEEIGNLQPEVKLEIIKEAFSQHRVAIVYTILHHFKLCFKAFLMASPIMFFNGWLGWVTGSDALDLQTKLNLSSHVYICLYTMFNGIVLILPNYYLDCVFPRPATNTVIQLFFVLFWRFVFGSSFLFIGQGINPISVWHHGHANHGLNETLHQSLYHY